MSQTSVSAGSAKIYGAKELEAALLALPDKLAEAVFRGATLAGVNKIRDAARRYAPIGKPPLPKGTKPGDLKRNIASSRGGGGRDTIRAFVGIKGRSRRIAHLVEFGHDILGHKGAQQKRGVYGRVAAHPFMRPALDTTEEAAVQAFMDYARARVDTEVRKLKDGA